jgi:hypothetical protein
MEETVRWQRVRIPPVERVVLTDIAQRRGLSDEEALKQIIREAAGCQCRQAGREEAASASSK